MKKKSDKIFILLIFVAIYFIMSWVVEGGMFSNTGEFVSTGIGRLGLFDIVSIIFSAFYYKLNDIFYILTVGGCYGVLAETKMYRKLVDKTSSFIKGKEIYAMVIITLLVGLYVSIASHPMIVFILTPFIVSVFLRNGYDRLTAISAGFGGIFIGCLGLTYGTLNVSYLYETMAVDVNDWIIQKWILFAIAYVLFNVFAILYMKKHRKVNATKRDMFCPESLDESKLKKKRQTKLWPLFIVLAVSLLSLFIGYINWVDSFGVKVFTEFYTSMTSGFKIADVPVFGAILGSYMAAFGTWADLLYGCFILIIGLLIIAAISKMKLSDFIKYFSDGMKKMSKVAFIYGFAFIVLFLASNYPWQNTFVNGLIGSGTFNVVTLLLIATIAHILIGDPSFCGYTYGIFLATIFVDYTVAASVVWRLGGAIALTVGPTSCLLLAALTYLDIPYKNWLKYIWKYVLSFVLLALIVLAVVVYV